MGMVLRPSLAHAPEQMLVDEAISPSLLTLDAVTIRPSTLEPGLPLQAPANYGSNAPRRPVEGWRSAPLLDAAAGPAPRDPYISVYTPTPPGSIQDSRTQEPPALMLAAQPGALQSDPLHAVEFNPGQTATIGG